MPAHFQNGIFKLNPLSGEISLGLSSEVLTVILDRMLGGDGSNHDYNRDLTQIEEALTKKIIEKIIKTLENSWCSVLPVKAEFTSLDNGYHVVPITTSGEIVALISFEIRLGSKNFGLINLCFPYPVLETVLQKLTPQYIFQHTNVVSNEIGRNEILNKINPAPLDLSVILGTANVLINDVLELKEGDVIKLDQKIDEKYIQDRFQHIVYTSAKAGEGREALSQAISQVMALEHLDPQAPMIANERQKDCVYRALAAVQSAVEALTMAFTLDAVDVCVEDAISCLMELTGERASEAVVEQVFARFCVGK